MDGNVGLSVHRSTTLIQTKISSTTTTFELLNGLPWNRTDIQNVYSVHYVCVAWSCYNLHFTVHPCVVKWQINLDGPQRRNPKGFGDLLTFPLTPPWGWNFCFLVKCLNIYWLDCHQIWYNHSWSPQDESKGLSWPSDFPLAQPACQNWPKYLYQIPAKLSLRPTSCLVLFIK